MTPRHSQTRSSRVRALAVVLHRFVGLSTAVFLCLAGLTGSMLAFYEELDLALNPELLAIEPKLPGARMLDPFELRDRVAAALPGGQPYYHVELLPSKARALSVWIQVAPSKWREAFVDPYTGTLRGSRDWGNLSEGKRNLTPFLYQLHYSLNLGETGSLLFGIVALLWFIDCFVGAYLTFPRARLRTMPGQRSWLLRFLPAWLIRGQRLFTLTFTFHRGAGLWLWALLLVFAWSGVSLNLGTVYKPVMSTVFGMQERLRQTLPRVGQPETPPQISLRDAHALGRKHMAEQALQRGFRVKRELALDYEPSLSAFVYRVESDLDVSRKYPRTEVYFDGQTGRLLGFEAPSGMHAGSTITSWLYALHFGGVGGLGYRIVVCLTGLCVCLLSVSGVWIWWRKREKRARHAREPGPTLAHGLGVEGGLSQPRDEFPT